MPDWNSNRFVPGVIPEIRFRIARHLHCKAAAAYDISDTLVSASTIGHEHAGTSTSKVQKSPSKVGNLFPHIQNFTAIDVIGSFVDMLGGGFGLDRRRT
jgi:hypothetical protein